MVLAWSSRKAANDSGAQRPHPAPKNLRDLLRVGSYPLVLLAVTLSGVFAAYFALSFTIAHSRTVACPSSDQFIGSYRPANSYEIAMPSWNRAYFPMKKDSALIFYLDGTCRLIDYPVVAGDLHYVNGPAIWHFEGRSTFWLPEWQVVVSAPGVSLHLGLYRQQAPYDLTQLSAEGGIEFCWFRQMPAP